MARAKKTPIKKPSAPHPKPQRVLVCGGRKFGLPDVVEEVLTPMLPYIGCIIEGGATGADALARDWAQRHGVKAEHYPIIEEDRKYGNGLAGNMHNARMLRLSKPTLVVAFPGGTWTFDMVKRATAAGVPVRQVVVQNMINICIFDNNRQVRLETIIQGEQLAWIAYDKEALNRLIGMLLRVMGQLQ